MIKVRVIAIRLNETPMVPLGSEVETFAMEVVPAGESIPASAGGTRMTVAIGSPTDYVVGQVYGLSLTAVQPSSEA